MSSPHVVAESFEQFLRTTPVSLRCTVCKFFRAYPTEAEGIRSTIQRRGFNRNGKGRSKPGTEQHVTPLQVATYIGTKYPDTVTAANVYEHWRNGHEEGR
jgi:hypothetical protein